MVSRLLDRGPKAAPAEPLLNYLDRLNWPYSVLEAASIQLAERHGLELLELEIPDEQIPVVAQATARGILWRHPSAVGDHVGALLQQQMGKQPGLFDLMMDVLLTCAARPGHRYDARRLDDILRREPMGKRDTWWNLVINYRFDRHTHGVASLIDWALSPTDKSGVGGESLFLASVTLGWFFTTPHRALRDQATKALVSLLRNRLDVCVRIVRHFHGVDDPYVQERVYAAAYGAAMLTPEDSAGLEQLALLVYQQIFAGDPPTDILLRDYARNICELALVRGFKDAQIDSTRIRPPYRSNWPAILPTRSELAVFYEATDNE